MLNPYIGQIDLSYKIENASPGCAATLTERLSQIEQQLGATLYRDLLEINAVNMPLYDEAVRLFGSIQLNSTSFPSIR